MARKNEIEEAVSQSCAALRPRAKSIIMTVWGDAIAPHGGDIWLGSLIELMRPLGLTERAVRTSVFRLQKEGWLTSRQIGRRSYYAFSQAGSRRAEQAERRIYANGVPPWDGRWHLIIANARDIESETREALRRELAWQGFGIVSPGCFAHPAADVDALNGLLDDLGVTDQVVVMRGDGLQAATSKPIRRMIDGSWDIAGLSESWREILDQFEPVARLLEAARDAPREASFVVRSLLIHEYRRVLLRDPDLPEELLPADWAGTAARELCHAIYRRVWRPAEAHLMSVLETADGRLPAASQSFYRRFGGLKASDRAAAE